MNFWDLTTSFKPKPEPERLRKLSIEDPRERKRLADLRYYYAHREELNAKRRARTPSPEERQKKIEYSRKYRQTHQAEVHEYKARYYAEHKDEINAKKRLLRRLKNEQKAKERQAVSP